MSLTMVSELQQELRRLAIAGCTLAKGDFKLKKMLPQLQQLGQKVPVFAKISTHLEQVVHAKDEQLQEPFLELLTLVNAVLYTQGKSDLDGELKKPHTLPLEQDTYVPFRNLAPLMKALTTSGSGRLQMIKDGFEAGYFKDLRVIPAAVKAMGDSYPDLADFICTRIIPLYGKEVIPLLREDFKLKGGKADGRRLKALHLLMGQPEGKDLALDAAENGSLDVKLAAVDILAEYPDTLEILMEISKSKNEILKDYALKAVKMKISPTRKIKGFFKKLLE